MQVCRLGTLTVTSILILFGSYNSLFSFVNLAGNLGIEVFEDERAPRVVFYDFGQACSLADDQAGGLLEVIESIVDLDAKKSVSAFSRMGVLKDGTGQVPTKL